ncbi:ADP-ribosylglycohydrolase family protein, partial [Pseudomonas carnis]|uniref:ADP-ribosylglycohydrolase family protein n=1 Tax=Pseudomonas carnis TaxID=2487355 RepID=UPI001F411122
CFDQASNFAEAILAGASLGDDADTTAAIVGQLAGAYYGVQAIPVGWLNKLWMRDEIQETADALFSTSRLPQ